MSGDTIPVVHVLEIYAIWLSSKLMRMLILLKIDGPQMIACIVLGSRISSYLCFSAQSPISRDFASFCDAIIISSRTNFMLHYALLNIYLKARKSKSRTVAKYISCIILSTFET